MKQRSLRLDETENRFAGLQAGDLTDPEAESVIPRPRDRGDGGQRFLRGERSDLKATRSAIIGPGLQRRQLSPEAPTWHPAFTPRGYRAPVGSCVPAFRRHTR